MLYLASNFCYIGTIFYTGNSPNSGPLRIPWGKSRAFYCHVVEMVVGKNQYSECVHMTVQVVSLAASGES